MIEKFKVLLSIKAKEDLKDIVFYIKNNLKEPAIACKYAKMIKDEIKESLSEISGISQKAEIYYLKKYSFDVFEPKIKKQIEEISEDYFG